jgi:predicted small metal-binding protein
MKNFSVRIMMMVIERGHLVEDNLQILEEKDSQLHSEKLLPILDCKKYGFDCNFIATSEDVGKIIKEFRKHTIQEHYIDYPEGVLMKFIMNKK